MAEIKKPVAVAKKAEVKKEETKVAAAPAAKAAEKKTAAAPKKAPEKKAATKTTATKTAAKATEKKVAEKKAPAKKTAAKAAKVETKASLFVQFQGRDYSEETLISMAKDAYKAAGNKEALKTINVYANVDDQVAYFVANGTIEGRFDI